MFLENISMSFNKTEVIKDLSIHIENGKLITLLGPSGCGKSTILYLIAGLYKPSKGNIYFNKEIVNDISAENRKIGMVFQNYALYPHMTVLKNIMFPLKMQKINKNEALEKVNKISELVNIKDLLIRKPSELSGGQQQRVAIARALVKEPELLLLDEPLSNLDAKLRIQTREEIRRIQKELKITTVFVTHDQEEALSISDKIILLNKGKLQQYGTPSELYEKPTNLFSAEFLGNPPINVYEGIVNEDKLFLTELNICIPIVDKTFSEKTKHQSSKVGIRPEDFLLSNETDFDVCGEIELCENIGRDTILKIKVGQGIVRCVVPYDSLAVTTGIVYLKIKQNKIHIFHCKSGEKL